MPNKILAIATLVLLTGCTNGDDAEPMRPSVDLDRQAQEIAASSLIVDTHVDVPYRLKARPADVSVAAPDGDFDYPRAVAGGLNAPFMSIYTPAGLESEGGSKAMAESLIAGIETLVSQAPDKFGIARSVAELRSQVSAGLISLPLGMENGSPLEGDLSNLQYFFDRGIRYITLAHSLSNHLSDSSYDENRRWNGLSPFGVDVIDEMNRLGIMIDVSHVSDDAFWQIVELSAVPVIASHSSARHFTPGFERNMSDEMIVALAKNGGVVQINFGSAFLTEAAMAYSQKRWAARDEFAAERPDADKADLDRLFEEHFVAENGAFPFASLDDVLDHFDHVTALVGIDHVGIGSDFDGVGDSLPVGLKDVSQYPNLVRGLLARGYSRSDVQKILGENLLRVWQAVEAYAATTSSST